MQTVTGRLTASAVVKELKDGRKLVSFTIAEKEQYKSKADNEVKEMTNFYNCSYWISTAIAPHMIKGAIVEVHGRIGLNVWNNLQGEARASLTLHVNVIKFHSKGKTGVNTGKLIAIAGTPDGETKEDLPF